MHLVDFELCSWTNVKNIPCGLLNGLKYGVSRDHTAVDHHCPSSPNDVSTHFLWILKANLHLPIAKSARWRASFLSQPPRRARRVRVRPLWESDGAFSVFWETELLIHRLCVFLCFPRVFWVAFFPRFLLDQNRSLRSIEIKFFSYVLSCSSCVAFFKSVSLQCMAKGLAPTHQWSELWIYFWFLERTFRVPLPVGGPSAATFILFSLRINHRDVFWNKVTGNPKLAF